MFLYSYLASLCAILTFSVLVYVVFQQFEKRRKKQFENKFNEVK